MHPKDADGMANSVDPDQTASSEAVWSWSALFAETYLSQYIEFVRNLLVLVQLSWLFLWNTESALNHAFHSIYKLKALIQTLTMQFDSSV